MDCPNCNSQDIEIGESEITGKDFTAKVWYASCHATIGEDVNWGGGYDCEFFIVRERKEALLAEVQLRSTTLKCPRCQVERQLLYRCPHCQSLSASQ